MKSLRIAYVGENRGTSQHRANAMVRLGHDVTVFECNKHLPDRSFVRKFHWETGGLFIGEIVSQNVWRSMEGLSFDVVWVDHGRYINGPFVEKCREKGMKTVVMNIDDPFGRRDRYSWHLYRQTVPFWDLVVVFRNLNILEAYFFGAKDVMRVFMTADEVAHAPVELTPEEEVMYGSDILFLGTYMKGRGKFLRRLVDSGLPLAIVGDRWNRCPEWRDLKPFWRSPGVYRDEVYARWIQGAKICLGLLSHENRDLHTTRSSEIPAIGSLLCAERTPEHSKMYVEGQEAVFWSNADECAEICRQLLADEPRRKAIADAGQRRVHANGTFNEPMVRSVLEHLMGS